MSKNITQTQLDVLATIQNQQKNSTYDFVKFQTIAQNTKLTETHLRKILTQLKKMELVTTPVRGCYKPTPTATQLLQKQPKTCTLCQWTLESLIENKNAVTKSEGQKTYQKWLKEHQERANKQYTDEELEKHFKEFHAPRYDPREEQNHTYEELFGKRRG